MKGGRLGVYVDSQENVRWSALSYRYSDEIPVVKIKDRTNVNFWTKLWKAKPYGPALTSYS